MVFLKPALFNSENERFWEGKNTPDYDEMCRKMYSSQPGQQYKQAVFALLKQYKSLPLLYMNFKSQNILNRNSNSQVTKSREKMFDLITTLSPDITPDIICLSEALVPDELHVPVRELRHFSKSIPVKIEELCIKEISKIQNDTITQPFHAAPEFTAKKNAQYKKNGGKETCSVGRVWKNFFAQSYKFIVFCSPEHCPWGVNWGNCVISKCEPISATGIHLPAGKKCNFGVLESRCAILLEFHDEFICTVHLEDREEDVRTQQTSSLIKILNKIVGESGKNRKKKLTLCGDLNSINKRSYTQLELSILTANLQNKNQKLPFDAIDQLSRELFDNELPLNTGQMYDSKFQKCVTHVFSDNKTYTDTVMPLTDATDHDHQPCVVLKESEKKAVPQEKQKAETAALKKEKAALKKESKKKAVPQEKQKAETAALTKEKAALGASKATLKKESEKKAVPQEKQKAETAALKKEKAALGAREATLATRRATLETRRATLEERRATLALKCNMWEEKTEILKDCERMLALEKEHERLSSLLESLRGREGS